ncbi:hypothetical protein Ancab_017524 [Ancistrocladus abbreviatus]
MLKDVGAEKDPRFCVLKMEHGAMKDQFFVPIVWRPLPCQEVLLEPVKFVHLKWGELCDRGPGRVLSITPFKVSCAFRREDYRKDLVQAQIAIQMKYRDVRLGRCDVVFGSLLMRVEFLLLAVHVVFIWIHKLQRERALKIYFFEGCGGSNPPGSIVGALFGVPLESVTPAILRIGHNNEACVEAETPNPRSSANDSAQETIASHVVQRRQPPNLKTQEANHEALQQASCALVPAQRLNNQQSRKEMDQPFCRSLTITALHSLGEHH